MIVGSGIRWEGIKNGDLKIDEGGREMEEGLFGCLKRHRWEMTFGAYYYSPAKATFGYLIDFVVISCKLSEMDT